MTMQPAAGATALAALGPQRTGGAVPVEITQPLAPSPHPAGSLPAGCPDCGLDRGVHAWTCPAVLGPDGGPGGVIRAWELAREPPEAAGPEAGL